jgi:predicted ester cyclase
VRWAAEGTHRGELLGIAATGLHIAIRGMTWLRLSNGRIVEGWDSWNQGRLMSELQAAAASAAA